MDLSIIIPTFNEEHFLPKLLKSIYRQNLKGKLEVIIVDCHSKDNTIREANKWKQQIADLKILKSKRDIGQQRNVGAKRAKYEHLLFLDADVILPDKLLNNLLKRINPKQRIVDNIVLLPYPAGIFEIIFAYIGNFLLWIINFFEPAMIGPFILTTRQNHRKIGGFKKGAIIGEDLDFAIRSVRSGAKNHMYLNFHAYNSSRRAEKMGRLKFLSSWIKAYLYVRANGPIYKDFYYPFGNYGKKEIIK